MYIRLSHVCIYINLEEEDQECEAGQKSEVRRENATKKNPQRSESAKKIPSCMISKNKIQHRGAEQGKARNERKM